MRINKQQKIRSISVFMIFLMIVSLLIPGLAGAEGSQNSSDTITTTNKISSTLKEAFEEEDKVTFLIKFNKTADLDAAKLEAEQKAVKAGLSNYKKKQYNNSAVLSALKETAFEEQRNVHSFLEEAVEQGTAEDLRSFYIVNGMAVTATQEVAERVAEFAEVETVVKSELRQLQETKDEVISAEEDDIEWNVDRVNAPEAWAEGFDGTGTVIASIDTGVQWDHPALKEHYYGYNPETGEVDHSNSWFDPVNGETEPYDNLGHGTHTIGTAVGAEPDGANQIGVAPGAKFISAQAFQEQGAADYDLIAAGEWIAERADIVDVVTNSWGGGRGINEFYMDIVDAWIALDIFPVFSAGNATLTNPATPGSVASPANYPQSFAVGNTDMDDMLADSSLLGPSPYDGIKPDVSAPGTQIRSAVPDNGYGVMSGTSMAGPAVSGIVALLRQSNSNLSVEAIKDTLKRTANERTDDEYTEVPNNGYGYGIVDAYASVVEPQVGFGTLEGIVEGVDGLPLEGEVSIEESHLAVGINPEDGSYSLRHRAGSFDVTVEAYGYETVEEEVEILKDEINEKNFQLEEAEKYEVSGQIVNVENGEPIANAQMHLVEDSKVIIENSDENGNYSFEAYNGEYTLKVMASGYKASELTIAVDSEDIEQRVELEVFYTYPGDEIGYDSGVADGYRTMEAGDKAAVRMSLPSDQDQAIVTGGVFKFWDDSQPEPGGTEFEVEVWDTSSSGGPNERIAGPFKGEAIRDKDEWTSVDLTEEQIIVDSDFFIVYTQIHDTENSPALGIDETNILQDREWSYSAGSWSEEWIGPQSLIRAQVAYETDNPSITSPEEGLITSATEVVVQGTASPNTTVQILNKGETASEFEPDSNGIFAVETELTEGENELTVGNIYDGKLVMESDPVTVISDTIDPEVTIVSPRNGENLNQQSATVTGSIVDANLDTLTVNGENADIDGESYSKQVLVNEGTNEIEVIATDKAGNQSVETIVVHVFSEGPTINNITPDEDVYLTSGEEVDISFSSSTIRGDASFEVYLPSVASTVEGTTSNMEEVQPGLYRGTWTVPENMEVTGAVLEVSLTDQAGNTTTEEAAGKLYVSSDKTDRIAGDIRYDTAIETSQAGWDTSDTVILARGDHFADALAGVPLAYGLDAPILLTPTDYLWEATAEEIARLGAQDIVILGGPNAVSKEVEAELTATGLEVDRVDGGDRFTTAALIAERVAPEGSSEIAVVNGMDFPDALSIASSAATEGMPILLAQENWISDKTLETIDTLNAETTYVAGGPKVVSEDLAAELPGVNRLEGSDRFGTNIDVLEHFGVESKHMYAATGMNYADALTGAVLAAKNDSSILFVHQRVPEVTSNYITDQGLNRITIFGGEVAVDESVEQELADLLQ